MIFQEPMTSLNPYHRVGDQIIESIQLHKSQPTAEATIEAKKLMSLVEIPEVDRRFLSYPHELSGGQRQRIMIAMALANEPESVTFELILTSPVPDADTSKSSFDLLAVIELSFIVTP